MALKHSITTKKGKSELFKEWAANELNIGRSKKKVPTDKKGQKQAVAIMLSMQQRAKTKKKSDSYWESFEEHLLDD